MKKVIFCLLTVVLFLTQLSSPADAAARVFEDISPKHRAYDAVHSLSSSDVFELDSDGKVRPGKYVTRMEAAVMTARILGLTSDTGQTGFRDVTSLNPYAREVAALTERGILQGFTDRTMRPNDILTRAQMAKIIVDAFAYAKKDQVSLPFKDVKSSHWSAPYVEALIRNNVTVGTSASTFSPDKKLTRAELMMLLHRAYKARAVTDYNKYELMNLIRGVQTKANSIINYYLYVNLKSPIDYSSRPAFSTFKQELLPYAEGDMLRYMEEYFKVTCVACDWIVYTPVHDTGLPMDILEQTPSRITMTFRYPTGMEDAHSETWTLVNRNGQWKMADPPVFEEAEEAPFHLTIKEAQAYLSTQYMPRKYSPSEYTTHVTFLREMTNGNYLFSIRTNKSSHQLALDPATADIFQYSY